LNVKRSVRIRLIDIIEAIDGAMEIVSGKSFEQYQQSYATKRAIERCVEIVSEASRYIPEDLKSRHPAIHWPEIGSIGNLLRHEYQRVDDRIIWRAATRYFPELRDAVTELLRALDRQD
jgi:uncharacterized protein with HEPN domain